MSDVKKKLLVEIDQKVKRKQEMRARSIESNTINAFVVAFIKNIEEINAIADSHSTWETMTIVAYNTLHEQLKSFDSMCKMEVSWHTAEGQRPQVNGVTIRWSKLHQQKHNVDPELFVDITSLIFG